MTKLAFKTVARLFELNFAISFPATRLDKGSEKERVEHKVSKKFQLALKT